MNTQIIQLQEEQGIQIQNGTWSNEYNTSEYFLEDGDEINIKQAFVDSSDKIKIEKDITATIEFVHYFFNHNDGFDDDALRIYEKTPAEVQPNNEMYIAGTLVDSPGGGATFTLIKTFSIVGTWDNWGTGEPGYHIQFTYKAPGDTNLSTYGPLFIGGPERDQHTDDTYYQRGVSINLVIQDGTFTDTSPDGKYITKPYHKVLDVGPNTESIAAVDTITPMKFTQSCDLPKAEYEPNELAHFITTQMNKIFSSDVPQSSDVTPQTCVKNNLFITKLQIDAETNKRNNAQTVTTYYSNKGDDICSMSDASGNMFLGTSSFSVEYGDQAGINKFMISNMHSPVLSVSTPGIKVQNKFQGANWPIFGEQGVTINNIGSSTGILLTKLSAVEKDTGESFDLWENKMGFDSKVLYNPQSKLVTIAGEQKHIPTLPVGLNIDSIITQQYAGLDSQINKTFDAASSDVPTRKKWVTNQAYLAPSNDGSDLSFFVASDEVIPIFASNSVSSTAEHNNPYYLINIDCMKNNLNGNKRLTTLSCVTGNYYGVGSYVLSQPSDSIPYIHSGEPISLSNFKVRILSKDGVNPNIGGKSHVFLELNKNPQNNPINKKQSSKK
tara:strand:- start:1367 stop:3193 length:1827 start_codon:yes stop_codon:yes gene_type:complete